MSGRGYDAEECAFIRSLIDQSPDATTSELARQFLKRYPGRSINGVRLKVEELRHAPPAKDESAEVQLWAARRERAEREAKAVPSVTSWVRHRLDLPPEDGAAIRAELSHPAADTPERRALFARADAQRDLEPCLCVSDAHIPYHSRAWWSLLTQVARDIKPQRIVIIGDFADFYSVSDHDKSPARANRMPEELAEVDKHLDELDALGATDKLYIEGNHENRLERHLMKAPGLWGVVTTEKLLKLKERGWEFVPYKRHAKRGAIHYTHDVNAAGRNAVFKALDTYQHSVVTGHTHRLQYIVEGSAVGDCKLSAMFGWGGDVEQVEYMCLARARKDWCLGFGVGYHDPVSEFTYWVPVPVVHSTCMVNGKLYKAA